MRGFGKKLPSTSILLPSSSSSFSALPYSTFGGGSGGSGGGRGRGRGFIPPPSPPPPHSPSQDQDPSSLPSQGHGRGAPVASGDDGGPHRPILPSFTSSSPSIGRGRGGPPDPNPTKQPIFFTRDKPPTQFAGPDDNRTLDSGPHHPQQPLRTLPGAGRGKAPSVPAPQTPETNRHARPRQPIGGAATSAGPATAAVGAKLNREEAIKKAVEVLSRGGGGGGRGGGRGRGVGMRGRGRGRGGGRGRRDADDELELYVGDNADGERFVKRMGEERMKLVEAAFEEVSYNVLPSPAEDAYLDALHTNNMVME